MKHKIFKIILIVLLFSAIYIDEAKAVYYYSARVNATVVERTGTSVYGGKVMVHNYDGDQEYGYTSSGGNYVSGRDSGGSNVDITMNARAEDGYSFFGWFSSSDAENPESIQNPYTKSYTTSTTNRGISDYYIYAKFSPINYTILFASNGGSGTAPATMDYDIERADFQLNANTFTRTAYTFSGWKPSSNVGNWKTSDSFADQGTISKGHYGDVTLTAQWTPITYTIKFAPGEHGSGTMSDATYNIAGTGSITSVPTSSFTAANGYEFSGWKVSSASDGSWTQNNPVSAGTSLTGKYGNVTLTAQWTPTEYTISFSGNGGTGTDPAQIPYTIESTGVTLPANPYTKTGYSFTGWQPTSNVGNWATSETYAAGATVPAGKYGAVTLQAKWDEMVDIVISVSGLQSGESAIFTVAKGSTTLYTVALNSTKSSLTINDQEPGEYTVTPLSWSWTYSMSSPITKTITSSDHTFEFTASKNTSKKHDEKSNVNWHTP